MDLVEIAVSKLAISDNSHKIDTWNRGGIEKICNGVICRAILSSIKAG